MKQYTMEDFAKGKFAVKLNTKQQIDKFLGMCARKKLRWFTGEMAWYFAPMLYQCGLPVALVHNTGKITGLAWEDRENFSAFGEPMIDFSELFQSYQILIDCDGTTTTATMTINGKEIKTAIARRNPEDKFDWKKGAALAFERLWNSPRKVEKKPEVREVKRWAKPGEYIRIVNAQSANNENYCNGDILRVTNYYVGVRNGWVNAKWVHVVIGPDEYVVLEGYRP